MVWGDGERADVFLGPVMITLFTRAHLRGRCRRPAEGFLHPALFTDDLDAELDGHDVVWGPAIVEGAFGDAPDRVRRGARAASASSSWSSSNLRRRVGRDVHAV